MVGGDMIITANRPTGKLILSDKQFGITNSVRCLRDGTRQRSEVIRTIPGNLPYDPVPFPSGKWKITSLDWQKKKGFDPKTYGPVKIRTDAWQWVRVWELDNDGDYLRESEEEIQDNGYLLHYSTSKTTLGCIRLASPEDAIEIAQLIQDCFDRKETVELEVI
jgi:hypothetical protein